MQGLPLSGGGKPWLALTNHRQTTHDTGVTQESPRKANEHVYNTAHDVFIKLSGRGYAIRLRL